MKALDGAVSTLRRLDCLGGFVVIQLYGLNRGTADLDVIELAPRDAAKIILEPGTLGGPLSKKHHVYLDSVGVAAVPENYEDRLVEMFPGAYHYLRLMALDPYDLALSKLQINSRKDRFDVRYLARTIPFDLNILQETYQTELSWQLGRPEREDLTLRLWIEAIEEGLEE